jgi:hypothetical protein
LQLEVTTRLCLIDFSQALSGTMTLMFRIIKTGGISLGIGVVVGLGGVAYLYSHRLDSASDIFRSGLSNLGIISITPESPIPPPSSKGFALGVATSKGTGSSSPENLPSQQNGIASANQPPSDLPPLMTLPQSQQSSSLPGPTEFGQYEQYNKNPSALFIDVLGGKGMEVKLGSKLTVQYKGWLTNGKEFDESYARGQAFTFQEGSHAVIKGWEEGLFGMKAGGKRRLVIPAAEGYGSSGQGTAIPPNSLLIFDVELVAVQ